MRKREPFVTVESMVPPDIAKWIEKKAQISFSSKSAVIREILVAAWRAEREAAQADTENG